MGRAFDAFKKALPAIMTAIGSGATIGAVFLAAKEGVRYKEETEGKDLTTKEKILLGAKIFAPSVGLAALSVGCGVGAHMMDKKTQASLVGAYAALSEGYKKYKAKNIELNGEDADTAVKIAIEDEKLPDGLKESDVYKPLVVHLRGLCDDIPEMTFVATKYTVLNAIVRANDLLEALESLSVNDLLQLFERDKIKGGDDVGWSYDMLWRYHRTTSLNFGRELNDEDGSLTVFPKIMANGGYLIDFELYE